MQVTQKSKVFADVDGNLIYRTGPGEYEFVDLAQLQGASLATLVAKVGGVEEGADDVDAAAVLAAILETGSGAPSSTPAAVGLFYIDTSGLTLYHSTGTSSSADWTASSTALNGATIKSLYEAESDTNAYDDAAVSKLGAIEASADVTDLTNVAAALITSGSGAPGTTPSVEGMIYVDTTADKVYIATGVASSGDWTLMTSA